MPCPNIISGTFYFQAYSPVQDKTVNITEENFGLNTPTINLKTFKTHSLLIADCRQPSYILSGTSIPANPIPEAITLAVIWQMRRRNCFLFPVSAFNTRCSVTKELNVFASS